MSKEKTLTLNRPMSSVIEFSRELRKSRNIKKAGIEEKIPIGGAIGFELEELLSLTTSIVDRMRNENRDQIEQQMAQLNSYLSPLTERDINEAYARGLNNSVKLNYRLHRRLSPERIEELRQEDNIRSIISTFTFDFGYSLRMSKRLEVKPSRALAIAERSYRINPQILINLSSEFPEFKPYVITHAAVYYPMNSHEFLITAQATIKDLVRKFPKTEIELLTYVAVNFPTKAEEYLHELEKLIPKLTNQFSEFSPVDVKLAVIHHSRNPEGFLKTAKKKYKELKREFSDLPERALAFSVLRYPLNPRKYLEDFSILLGELEEDFPDFSHYFITQAIYSRFKGARKFLEDAKLKTNEYKQRYPTATESVLKQACIYYPNNPDAFIEANSK